MARYVLQLGGLGFVRTKTLKAFPETAYRESSARSAEPRRLLPRRARRCVIGEKPNTAKEDTTPVGPTALPRAATTPRGTATDTKISRVRIISDRVGGMRCAIIETIDCPENKEFPRSPCNAAKAQVPKRIAKG